VARALTAALAAALLVGVPGAGGASGAETPRRGGTVVFGPTAEPACLNPLVCGYEPVNQKVLTPAFALAPDLTLKPRLVSGVVYTTKPPFTLTYRIRPEARWSDGVPVTARDFIFTHAAFLKLLAPDHIGYRRHGMVQSIRALDPKTVRVVLRSRVAGWRGLFWTVLPWHALRGEKLESVWGDRMVNPKTGAPIGSGPFLVEAWDRGKQLTLVRNRNYWGPHVSHLDRVVIKFQDRGGAPPPAQVLEWLRTGESDFAEARDTEIVPDLRRMPGISVVPAMTNGWEHLDIRIAPGGHPALRKKLVRQALAYGIDRVEIVRELFGELDPRYRPSDSAVFLGDHVSYRPNWNIYRYRPEESRRLFEQAGCRSGLDTIYVCDGRRLELGLVTTAGARLRERTIKLIQAQLRRAGVEVELSYTQAAALFTQLLPSGSFDLAAFSWFGDQDGGARVGLFVCDGFQNYSGYCQRLTTRELAQTDRILESDERSRVLNRADRLLAKDVPVIPLYQVPNVLAYRTTIRNVVRSPENLFWNVEDWWLAR
jgi:peptide/nickel transport system substrate-binding protein